MALFQLQNVTAFIQIQKLKKNSRNNMKNYRNQCLDQHLEDSQDNSQQQKTENSFFISKNNKKINLYTFPSSQTNYMRVLIIFLLRYLLIANNFIAFSVLYDKEINQSQTSLVFEFFQSKIIYSQLILIFLSIWILGSFIYIKIYANSEKINEFLIIKAIQYGVQLNFHLNGFLLMYNLTQNIVLFIISASFSMYSAIFFQNYIIKADYMYHSSINSNIVYYAITISAYLFNAVSSYTQNLTAIRFIVFFYGILYTCWYFMGGKTLYVSLINKNLLLVFLSLELYCGFMMVNTYILKNDEAQTNNIFQFLSLNVCFFMSFKSIENKLYEKLVTHVKDMSQDKIIEIELIAKILKHQLPFQEYEVIIIGIIKYYQAINPYCLTNSLRVYDSVSKTYIPINNLWIQCQVFLKHFIRQKYQQIQKEAQSIDFQLKYCEFMINQQPNQSIITQRIEYLSQQSINCFQKIQLQKMKKIIEDKVSKLNAIIFNGSLQIQNLVISEQFFVKIEQKIKDYLFKNISLWSTFSQNQLNLFQIKKIFIEILKLVKEMDKYWSYLSRYFSIHRRWRYLYINYKLYIKNKKITMRELEGFKQSDSLDNIFKQDKIYIGKHESTNQILQNKFLLFDSQTSAFHASLQHEQLFISRISQYFTKNFLYEQPEIIGANLNIMLPMNLREKHMEKVLHWMREGYEVNEQSYLIKLSSCIDKQGNEIPVFKCFKTFVNFFKHQMQYVCLLKTNKDKEGSKQKAQTLTVLPTSTQCDDQSTIYVALKLENEPTTSLSHQNNIFIKDECYLPVEELKQLKNIKFLVRSYALVVTIIILSLAILNYSNSNDLVRYSSQYINFMQTYRLPMILASNFYKQILQIGNQAQVKAQIIKNAQLFRQIAANQLTLQTLFDDIINKPANYYPLKPSQTNQNASYNQIELFYLINSVISTLSNEENINVSSRDFLLFNDYLKPGYDNLLNRTKLQFHHIFERDICTLYQSILITLYIQIGVLIFFLIISLYKIISFFERIKSIIINIAEFKNADMKIIYHYWCKTFLIFEKLILKNQCIKNDDIVSYRHLRRKQFGMQKLSELTISQNQNININRQSKQIIFNKEAYRFKIKIFLLVSFTMLCSFIIVLGIQVSFIKKFSEIGQFQKDGFEFLQYYPAATIVGVGCLQKTFASIYPNISGFTPSIYDDVLSDLWLVGNFKYISRVQDQNSLYYTKQRVYFFQNPCEFNPKIAVNIGMTQNQCQKIYFSSFSRGLTAFMRLAYTQAFSCIKGSSLMTSSQLDEFSRSVSLLSAYILDAITTWGNQFNTRINTLISSFFQSTILQVLLIIGIHLLLFELLVLRQLKKQYRFYRLLYLSMVPQYILTKDKIIKQKFMSNKIISIN